MATRAGREDDNGEAADSKAGAKPLTPIGGEEVARFPKTKAVPFLFMSVSLTTKSTALDGEGGGSGLRG